MPTSLYLDEFGSQVWSAFGEVPFLVGSALAGKTWRDVDVRLILDDETWAALELGRVECDHQNAKWNALVMAWSALGKQMTGLPIDFQIQQRTWANATFDGPRSALGLVPLRIRVATHDPPTRDEAHELLWRLRRYETLDDTPATEDEGVELAKAFDDWYARNPDPGASTPPASPGVRPKESAGRDPGKCATWCGSSVERVPMEVSCHVRGALAYCTGFCAGASNPGDSGR